MLLLLLRQYSDLTTLLTLLVSFYLSYYCCQMLLLFCTVIIHIDLTYLFWYLFFPSIFMLSSNFIWFYFLSSWRMFFSVIFRVDLLVTNSLVFVSLKMYLLAFIFKRYFCQLSNSRLAVLFSSNPWRLPFHCPEAFIVSMEKSTVILLLFLCRGWVFFSVCY